MLYAILLSLLAGLATGLGGLIVVSMKKVSKKTLGFGLGLSSGIMVIIGIRDLFGKSIELSNYYLAVSSFMAGALFILAIDYLVPHEFIFKEHGARSKQRSGLLAAGMIMALGITIHNIPEGMIVGAGYATMPAFGIILAIAIALHNIPEGIAVSVPLCASGCSKRKTFTISLLSGLAEPLGAVVAVAFLSFMPGVLPVMLGFAGGVMTYITMDELIPTAEKYGSPHAIGLGIMAGLILAMLIGQLA
ncbi:MAG: ZIP family metal transporter [Candidatus Aenigmarchaeota archaeon]|nr:ZIP family metal transporter [Candidatus Aenigmarchaeota archaeon]